MRTNIIHQGRKLEVDEWRWWHIALVYGTAIILALILAFVAFHFSVKMTIWYAKLRGWV